MAADKTWKVGELARLTGVSVRTLHHYHNLGLLCPSERSESGYRLYAAGDIARLQQIKSLRQMGFSLEDVRACLERIVFSPEHIIELHLARAKEQIALQQQLCARLEAVRAHMSTRQTVSVEEFLKITEAITMIEKYYTPEQIAYLKERKDSVGEERIREVEAEWPRLMDEVKAAMVRGDAPESRTAQELAKRWKGLVNEFTGGNPEIHASLTRMYQEEPVVADMNTDERREMFDYITQANEAASP